MNKTKITSIAIIALFAAIMPNIYAETTELLMEKGAGDPNCNETDTCFTPSTLLVTRGTDVLVINNDIAAHTVTSGSMGGLDGKFDTGMMMTMTEKTINGDLLQKDANYEYFCMVHPWMEGEIHVIKEFYNLDESHNSPYADLLKQWHSEGKITDSDFYWNLGYWDDKGYLN